MRPSGGCRPNASATDVASSGRRHLIFSSFGCLFELSRCDDAAGVRAKWSRLVATQVSCALKEAQQSLRLSRSLRSAANLVCPEIIEYLLLRVHHKPARQQPGQKELPRITRIYTDKQASLSRTAKQEANQLSVLSVKSVVNCFCMCVIDL